MEEKWYKKFLRKVKSRYKRFLRRTKAHFKRIGKAVFDMVHKTVEFTEKYPKETAIFVVGSGAVLRFTRRFLKSAKRERKIDKETYTKQTRVWDPSERHYWHLKRPLTDDEWRYVEKLRSEKYGYSYILSQLGVLV